MASDINEKEQHQNSLRSKALDELGKVDGEHVYTDKYKYSHINSLRDVKDWSATDRLIAQTESAPDEPCPCKVGVEAEQRSK